MNNPILSLLAGMTALVFTAGALSAQQPFFSEDFENLAPGLQPGDVPFGDWDVSVVGGNYSSGTVQVVEGSAFPGSTQHLQVRNANHYFLGLEFDRGVQVATASFDLITRPNDPAVNPIFLLVDFYGSNPSQAGAYVTNSNRLHSTGINTVTSAVGGAGVDETFGEHGQLVHFDMIMNNSLNEVSHFVGGTEYVIPSGQASVWVDGSHLVNYNYLRGADGQIGDDIMAFAFTTGSHSTARNSYDLNNFGIYDGVFVIPEPSTYALIFGGLALAGAVIIRRRRR